MYFYQFTNKSRGININYFSFAKCSPILWTGLAVITKIKTIFVNNDKIKIK